MNEFKIKHGRKGLPDEYLEIGLSKPALNVVVQKNKDDQWFGFLVERGKNGGVWTVQSFDNSEDARFGLEIIANSVIAHANL